MERVEQICERRAISVGKLVQNNGQIEGVPKNPRTWEQVDVEHLAKSIEETPELFDARGLIVVPHGGKFVVIGGNMRLAACRQLKLKELPCMVLPEDTDAERLKAIAIKDNGSFGGWDFEALKLDDWDPVMLEECGIQLCEPDELCTPDGLGEKEAINDSIPGLRDKGDEYVEGLLNEAMIDNITESLAQMEYGLKKGWICTFLTRGLACAKFIRAKYYGEHYPQWMSLYFCPERIKTSANKISPWEQMEAIAARETRAGIAGLRTLSQDHLLLSLLLKGNYPFGGARMPMDFPANIARKLISEFAPNMGKGASILDPCHGWGGRLVGALMADVGLYVGVDPSDEANAGVRKTADAYLPYSPQSEVQLFKQPFEDVDLSGREFDFALTSPPYFDVEQYHGQEQAHIRYPEYDKWVDGFYRPLINKVFLLLKSGAVFCLQVGSQTYPLLKDGAAIARDVGFDVEEIRPLGGMENSLLHNNTSEDESNEKIIVLRKPFVR